ncbi:MAG: hypothetical protein COB60_03510 [Flavobacteriaceae bacterium]|nr:MAG: hypothetical protein COB60_03510 [Flavobacteriaceae bacterium]
MEFTLTTVLQASPKEIYAAWLNSDAHTKMTGGQATASHKIGGAFTAWDGYIWGANLELIPTIKIVQSWRTNEFEEAAEDAVITVVFKEENGATLLTLVHTNVPEDGDKYKKGWVVHYFEPMAAYFSKK